MLYLKVSRALIKLLNPFADLIDNKIAIFPVPIHFKIQTTENNGKK